MAYGKGCWSCKHLEYFSKDNYESSDTEGWFCNKRDEEETDKFVDFPCQRKLKCFEKKEETLK